MTHEPWPPCRYCGNTNEPPTSHVHGKRKCCPDCDHTPIKPKNIRYINVQYINGARREVAWSERRDSGGMFDATVGVYAEGDKFVAYILDWGRGVASPKHDTLEAAKADIARLWARLYGGDA